MPGPLVDPRSLRDAIAREESRLLHLNTELGHAQARYVGEGFDDARLDTLLLAIPVSWKGTLVRPGRIDRQGYHTSARGRP